MYCLIYFTRIHEHFQQQQRTKTGSIIYYPIHHFRWWFHAPSLRWLIVIIFSATRASHFFEPSPGYGNASASSFWEPRPLTEGWFHGPSLQLRSDSTNLSHHFICHYHRVIHRHRNGKYLDWLCVDSSSLLQYWVKGKGWGKGAGHSAKLRPILPPEEKINNISFRGNTPLLLFLYIVSFTYADVCARVVVL